MVSLRHCHAQRHDESGLGYVQTYFSSLSVSVMRLEEKGELSRDTLI
jgi:hypothetical protein